MTMTEVDPDDPAFERPDKFVGPVYGEVEARHLAETNGWQVRADGKYWRRVVPSPAPKRILELAPIEWLLERHTVVICAGGGGIPTVRNGQAGTLSGVEAVIDKDRTSAVLARGIGADLLVIATDVPGVFEGWGTKKGRMISEANPDALHPDLFAAGSMKPKVMAAVDFARLGRGAAVIGSLDDIEALISHRVGTWVSASCSGLAHRSDGGV